MHSGAASSPCSAIHAHPVISPLPLNEWMPANTASVHTSGPRGQIAVTPLRTIDGLSRINVVKPTRTPGTSVIAFQVPLGSVPVANPRSRSRARGMAYTLNGHVQLRRRSVESICLGSQGVCGRQVSAVDPRPIRLRTARSHGADRLARPPENLLSPPGRGRPTMHPNTPRLAITMGDPAG